MLSGELMAGLFGFGCVLFGWLLHGWTLRRKEKRTAAQLAEIFDMEIWDICVHLQKEMDEHPVPCLQPIRSDLFENYFEKAFELPARAAMSLFIFRKNLLACEEDRKLLMAHAEGVVRTNPKATEKATKRFTDSVDAVLLTAKTYTLLELRKLQPFNYAGAWERLVIDKLRPKRAAEQNALVEEDPFPAV